MAEHPASDVVRQAGPGARGVASTLGATAERHVLDYVRTLSKRRWTALPVFAAVVGVTAYVTMTAQPLYEARAQLLIEADQQNVISFQQVVQQAQESADFYQTQFRILQSRSLAKTTLDTLELWKHPEFGGAPVAASDSSGLAGRLRQWWRTARGTVSAASAEAAAPTPVASGDQERLEARALDHFARRLEVAPVRNSRLVDVKFRANDPKLAAAVANALADVYIRQNEAYKFNASKQATDWLTQQLAQQRREVEQSELATQRYREQHATVSTENSQNIVLQKLSDLNAAVTRAKTERLEKEALAAQAAAAVGNREALASFPAVLANASVQRLRIEVAEHGRRLQQLSGQYGERHPEIIAARAALATSSAALDREIDAVVRAVQDEYRTAADQERRLVTALEAQKAEVLALNRREIGYRALERDAASNRQIFESLLQRTKETGISGELKTNNIRITDPADVPQSPIWPRVRRSMALAVLGGAFLAICMAFGAEYLDNKIKSPDEIRAHLGLPCLGLIPQVTHARGQRGPLVVENPPASFAEAIRAVRSNLLFASAGLERRRVIAVTSTGPAEGKTVVAANLAAALALVGQRVLLIDADLRRPRIHDVFACDLKPGLSDLLDAQGDAPAAFAGTSVPGLSLLPAGTLPLDPAERLSSPRFTQLLDALAARFDWVILDAPPVMPVTDASLLAHVASAVVFVVGAEVVPLPSVTRALEQLDASGARYLGVVLNKARLQRNSFFYAPYHRRAYEQYYTQRSA